jgi:uncharacterized protein CbrC (UPF0167 family)
MELPKFKYHPDPISTGSIEESNESCDCCGKKTGYIYSASFYCIENIRALCPWCIASGEAAEKYGGQFNDDYPLEEASLNKFIIKEVIERTPGYSSWQQEVWQHHCNDACEFHGDAKKEDLECILADELKHFLFENGIDKDTWSQILENYEEGGDTAVYKFVCRICKKNLYALDFS